LTARRVAAVALPLAVILAACAPKARETSDSTRSVGSVISPGRDLPTPPATVQDTNVAEQARLSRLEHEARELAKTDGCSSVEACRTAPVGWRSCGGPRTYLVYCAASTDTLALFRKLAELEKAERAYNLRSGMMSTCEFRMPPTVKLQGGRCRE
jgi:hypothetical protein